MPRFTILLHDHPELHWDFLLEEGKVLRSWRLLPPFLKTDLTAFAGDEHVQTIDAESISDHRKLFLDYEGEVSGNRGRVTQIDSGLYHLLSRSEDRWEIRLEGATFSGFVTIVQEGPENSWKCHYLHETIPDV